MGNRLVLGTAQFGFPYGIANRDGQISYDDVEKILDYAMTEGVDTLDTAIVYGESEQRLGKIGVSQWKVISKLPKIPDGCANVTEWARRSILESLERLRVPKLHAMLLHHPQDLLEGQGEELYQALFELKNQNKIDKLGVSIYSPDELDGLLPQYQFDLVQAPFNVVDRRLVTSGWLSRVEKSGIEVYIRSVFLQGLLLMGPAALPEQFKPWRSQWGEFYNWLSIKELTPLQACLGYVLSQSTSAHVIVGVDNLAQLQEIIIACNFRNYSADIPDSLASTDLDLINPSRWSTL